MGNHVRILPSIDNQTNKFDYLEKLEPNPQIMQLLEGLQSGTWDAKKAWDAKILTENEY
jgi:hypothetical protein